MYSKNVTYTSFSMQSGKQGAKTLGRHYFSWWWRGKCPDCMYRYDTYQRAFQYQIGNGKYPSQGIYVRPKVNETQTGVGPIHVKFMYVSNFIFMYYQY